MNRNALKTIACLTMFLDHMGLLLFPDVMLFRYIGRLSLPLFAFFIAEGARYTSHKLRYFLRLFLLGAACQAVYFAEQIISHPFIYSYYFNILLTFSVSLLLCFAYLHWEKTAETGDAKKIYLAAAVFLGSVLLAVGLCAFCSYVEAETYYEFAFDYGLHGMLLPLATLISKDKQKQLLSFSMGLILFCVLSCHIVPHVWFSLLTIPLIALYNGQKGKSRFKYGFYLFYPAHLALLYLLAEMLP